MDALKLIAALQDAVAEHGNVPCLIEVWIDGEPIRVPIGEASFEDRPEHGASICLLQ
jgi:hypothetical protein